MQLKKHAHPSRPCLFLSPPISSPLSHISKIAIKASTAFHHSGPVGAAGVWIIHNVGQETESEWPARNPGILVLLFLSLAQPVELQSGTYLQTGSVITHARAYRQRAFSHSALSESVSPLHKYIVLPVTGRNCVFGGTGEWVGWREFGCGWRGNYARLTHINLSSVCFLRARARTPLFFLILSNSLCVEKKLYHHNQEGGCHWFTCNTDRSCFLVYRLHPT